MGRAWLVVVALTVFAAAAGAAQAAAPVIERVDFDQTRGYEDGFLHEHSTAVVLVRDADGADDIAEITVGPTTYLQGWSGNWEWTEEEADTVRLTIFPTNVIAGECTVSVADASSHSDSLTCSTPTLSQPPPAMATPAGWFPVIADPNVTFSWTGLDPSGDDLLVVTRTSGREVWRYDPGMATSAAYNADGTARDATLQPGFAYRWEFISHLAVDDGATDPRVHTYIREQLTGNFIIFSSIPTIEGVTIVRASDNSGGGLTRYGQNATVLVTDCDGADGLASVTITDPDGVVHVLTPASYPDWQMDDPYTVRAFYELKRPLPELAPPATGSYAVLVTDAGGDTATLVTPPAGNPPAPAIVSPADGAVIEETHPLLHWDTGLAASLPSSFFVYVQGAGGDGSWWHYGTGNQCEYGGDDPIWGEPLLPGATCSWEAWASTPLDDGDTDSRVRIIADQVAWGRFSISEPWPALPALEGKLAFTTSVTEGEGSFADTSLIEQYDPDPSVRRWLGPVSAESPDWSLDGTKLAYTDGTVWADALDGDGPTPVAENGLDPRWSPDGSEIVYTNVASWSNPDIWVAKADGSESHPVVDDDFYKRYPAWSPDGQWIAYRRTQIAGSSPQDGLWLVHPDGTELHQLLPSGVQGYPDYGVDWVGAGGWAPDAGRLAVEFGARLGDGPTAPSIGGIGVVSRDGGVLKPIFLTPTGVVCCAAPKSPNWSGDGTKVVFSSAHHLPVNPQWVNGQFEPGVELWMISADGSGEPTRLTYNRGYDGTSSWWVAPLFPDVPKGHWAYCAVSTCAQAGLVEGFPSGNYQPSLTVTRDQMAVYIARALAGGDIHVPSGPAAPTFSDVDRDHWAYDYVEYCATNGIVQGYWNGYRPGEVVTRDQMAVYVSRAIATPTGDAGLEGYTGPATPSFADVGTDHWAYRYIEYAKEHGVVQGYGDDTYHPEREVTRDQMAMYIARAFHLPM